MQTCSGDVAVKEVLAVGGRGVQVKPGELILEISKCDARYCGSYSLFAWVTMFI